jgi:subtilisin-like proprotein convertase family protein
MGDWRLRISDPLGGGSGNLADWTLKLCLNLFAVSPGSPNDVPVFVDTDGDGVADIFDNCTNVSNADQRDTDGDGYGNRCDADLDNSGFVNITDLGIFKSRFGTSNADADLDGNGFVNITDLGIFKSLFGKPPGPSGVAP